MSFKDLLSQLQSHLRQSAAGSPCLLTAPALAPRRRAAAAPSRWSRIQRFLPVPLTINKVDHC